MTIDRFDLIVFLSYVLFLKMLDSDVFITEPETLKKLIAKGHAVTAPMLRSEGLYSNFWCGMTSQYYYQRTEAYEPILYRREKGCHSVPMVHTSVLIDLRVVSSDGLSYLPENIPEYQGPHDDIIAFALSANKSG